MGWVATGVTVVLSVVSSISASRKRRKALEAKQRQNIQIFKNQKVLSEFAQFNNSVRANDIIRQQAAEAAEAKREVTVVQREVIGDEVLRRGEGLTAGTSLVRSIDSIIAKGDKAIADVVSKEDAVSSQVLSQANQANAKVQTNLINHYNNMLLSNATIAAQQSSTLEDMLGVINAGVAGFKSGAALSSAIGGMSGAATPSATTT